MTRRPKPQPILIGAVCGWELAALTSGRVPTITRMVHRHRDRWPVRLAVLAAIAWTYLHLLIEEDRQQEGAML